MNEMKTKSYRRKPFWQIVKNIDDVNYDCAEFEYSLIRINKFEKILVSTVINRLNEFFVRRLDDGTEMKEIKFCRVRQRSRLTAASFFFSQNLHVL